MVLPFYLLGFLFLNLNAGLSATDELSFFDSALSFVSQKVSASVSLARTTFDNVNLWIFSKLRETKEEASVWALIMFAFLAGLSVSMTPCIYPLIPITMGILSSRRTASPIEIGMRALFYLLGIASVFSLLGVLAIKFNLIFGSWLGSPWVIMLLFFSFVVLALSLFDVIELDFMSNTSLKVPEVHSVFSSFAYGAVTALVTSPCMTPALLTLLSIVAQRNDIGFGILLLFLFSLGMTFLIILFSLFSSLYVMRPKPGSWMVEIRKLLGFGILFLALTFLEPILAMWQSYMLWAIMAAIMSFYYFSSSKKDSVSSIIKAHQESSSDVIEYSIWDSFSFNWLMKKKIAYLAAGFAIFYLGKSYLIFKKIKLISLLMKWLR